MPALLVAIALAACAVSPDEETRPGIKPVAPPLRPSATIAELVAAGGGQPVLVTDAMGREWSVRKATFAASDPGDDSAPPPKANAPSEDTLTDEELADRMRAVRLVGEYEFTEVHGNVERVKAARAKTAAGARLRVDPHDPRRWNDPDTGEVTYSIDPSDSVATPLQDTNLSFPNAMAPNQLGTPLTSSWWRSDAIESPSRESPFMRLRRGNTLEPHRPTSVFGTESRSWVSTIWGWPHGAAVKHTPSFATAFDQGGSATLIGRRTAIAAAHSFYAGGAWAPAREWAADIIQHTNIYTNARTTETVYGPYFGCYTVTIPYGYHHKRASHRRRFRGTRVQLWPLAG